MNQSTVVEVLEQLLAQEKAKLGPIVTPPGPAARVPIQVDNVVPPAWSPAIAAMRQQDYLAVFAGGVRPTPLPLSASQALASWANRPEASDFDYQQIRDGQLRLAKRLPINVEYGVAIPKMMAEVAAEVAADPKPQGFLPGETVDEPRPRPVDLPGVGTE